LSSDESGTCRIHAELAGLPSLIEDADVTGPMVSKGLVVGDGDKSLLH